MSTVVPTTSFAGVTAVHPDGDARWRAELDEHWTIGGHPNGGYLLAVAGRAGVLATERPHVLAASAQYLRSPAPGPVALETEVLRPGRTGTHVRVRMSQADEPCVETLLVTGTLEQAGSAPSWSATRVPTTTVAGQGLRVPTLTPTGVPVPIMDQVAIHLDPDTTGFAAGAPTGRGELAGWRTMPAPTPADPEGPTAIDDLALLYAVDALPPASFDIARTGWVPTLSMSVYVRALPAPGPVHVRARAALIDDGRIDETVIVHDVTGRLVAQGTQLAGIRYP